MSILEALTKAIELRKPIIFQYNVPNKVTGIRYGHPHAIFFHPTTNNMMIHIYQLEGVSDTKDKIPGWRQPILNYISEVIIQHDDECFENALDYKPNSLMYEKIYCKV